MISQTKPASKRICAYALFVVMTILVLSAAGLLWAQAAPSAAAPELAITMQDGSILTGHFQDAKVTITTKYGNQEISGSEIVGLSDGQFSVTDGSKLKGNITTAKITLLTAHGNIELPASEIKGIAVKNASAAPKSPQTDVNGSATTQPASAMAPAAKESYDQPGWKGLQGTWAGMCPFAITGGLGGQVIVTVTLAADGSVAFREVWEGLDKSTRQYSGTWRLDAEGVLIIELDSESGPKPQFQLVPLGRPFIDGIWLKIAKAGGATQTYVRVGADGNAIEPPPQIGLTSLDSAAVTQAYLGFTKHWTISPQPHGARGATVATGLVGVSLIQCRAVYYRVSSDQLNDADKLNGIEWKGLVSFYATATRWLDRQRDSKQSKWDDWKEKSDPIWRYSLTKRVNREWETEFSGGPIFGGENIVVQIPDSDLRVIGGIEQNAIESTKEPSPATSQPSVLDTKARGEAQTATDPNQQFKDRISRPGAQPEKPDKDYTDAASGVTVKFPADFERSPARPPAVGIFLAQGYKDKKSIPSSIVVICRRAAAGTKMNLDQLYKDTITPVQRTVPGSQFSDPVSTKMAGVDACAFTMDTSQDAQKVRKAMVITWCKGKMLAVILTATPETFDQYWDDFKRVCDSCQVR
jgi:hypothetical protein